MRIGREEALDLFLKWLSDRTLIRCSFEFSFFAAVLRGRVLAVEADCLRLISDDTFAELALQLPSDLEFAFGDSRDDVEVSELSSVVCLTRPAPPEVELRDCISLSEIIEAS